MLLKKIMEEVPSLPRARLMFLELMKYFEEDKYITLQKLEQMIPENESFYTMQMENEPHQLSGEQLEQITPLINASVYLFSSDAFYSSVFKITSDNAQREEYLTDVVRILANDSSKSWKIIPAPVKDHFEVLSYNNPEELLKIEEYYNQKESQLYSAQTSYKRIDVTYHTRSLRPVEEWLRIIEDFGHDVKRQLREVYGDNEELLIERRNEYLRTLRTFIKVYGKNNSVVIARSPGRVNIMGRHVDHRGGYTNLMTINREVILVTGGRKDDIINIHNVDSQNFRPRFFSIGSELSRLPWDEWLNMISSETVQKMIHSTKGDWSNYFKAVALRLQEKYKGHLIYGFNGVLSGRIPLAAGLSSSSAVVVSAAEALTFINGLSFIPKEFVDLCGEGEWFVGTRGGSADHAAMKFGEKGNILHMGFNETRIEDIIPFPKKFRLIILHSHQSAKKSEEAMQIYNEKVATYEVAQAIVKSRFPRFRNRIIYFRDINTGNLGLKPYEIYDILLAIPEHVTRKELIKIISEEDKERMELIFSSHKEPEGGYESRRLTLFGISEIARGREFARLMKDGNIEDACHLMNISHDGDRISRLNKNGERVMYDNSASDNYILTLQKRSKDKNPTADIHLQPGGYGCSTFLIDEMVDIAKNIDGVIGAQLSGAGLGGCIMALVKDDAVDNFQKIMISSFYEKHNFSPQILVCTPIAGSGIFSV